MAFYFRKFRQTMRLIPPTKSLGYSTWLNEGDKAKEGDQVYVKSPKDVNNSIRNQEVLDVSLLSSSSALVPLSVRDMALVLCPRLQGSHGYNLDELVVFSDIVKTVPYTCDDILTEYCYAHNAIDTNTTLERTIMHVEYSNKNVNSPVSHGNKISTTTTSSPLLYKNDAYCSFSNKQSECSNNAPETVFMSSMNFSPNDGFLFSSSSDKGKEKPSKDGPSAEQLHSVKGKLEKQIIQMFKTRYDYSILHKDVVLENCLFGERSVCRGHVSYALELLKLRMKIHARFSNTVMEVLNTTVQEESGVIRIHWRLKGLPQTELLKFWRLFMEREEISKDDWEWFEAFSYFHIGKDGLVHKHKIDRMLPGSEERDKLSVKLRKLFNPAKPLVN